MHAFIPESLTPIARCPSYGQLCKAERLRANQLIGLLFNEHFQVFEGRFFDALSAAIQHSPVLSRRPDLQRAFIQAQRDEHRHRQWFQEFAKRSGLSGGTLHFIKLPRWLQRSTAALARRPALLPLCLRALQRTEAYSCHLAQHILNGPIDEFGTRCPRYAELHARHAADEARHVTLDDTVLAVLSRRQSRWQQRLETTLVEALCAEMSAPKRGVLRVVDRLCVEFPRLGALRVPLRQELVQVGRSAAWQQAEHLPQWRVAALS